MPKMNCNTTESKRAAIDTMSDSAIERELGKADALLKDFDKISVMVPREGDGDDDEVFVHYNGLNIRFAREQTVVLRTPIIEILEQAGLRVLRMDAQAAASMQ